MQDTCGIHVSSEVIKIHAGYMRDTCVDTCRDTCGTRISGVWGYPSAPASRARDTYPRMYPFVSDMYRACIMCVMYLRVKIHCILNVSLLYPKCIVKKDTYPQVRYISYDSQSDRYKCILLYLDVSRCILTGHIKIHARYMHDTCTIHVRYMGYVS